jgi:gas vesicle protein
MSKEKAEEKTDLAEALIEEGSKTLLKVAKRTLENLKETCNDIEALISKIEETVCSE